MKSDNLKFVAGAAFMSACLMATPTFAGGVATTVTTLALSKTSIAYNEDVTLTTTVTNSDGRTCTGMVMIQPLPTPSAVTCGIALVGGPGSSTGSCQVNGSVFGGGTHSLSAQYESDNMLLCASSVPVDMVLTVAGPVTVPTTSEWTLWGLAGLLLLGGGVYASRRFRSAEA